MPSLICPALIAFAPMLMLFLTPGGVCLLLASPFWTVGMDVVFYFVDNQYPGKVVAVVSAVVAILFVFIVLSISVILLWQEGRQGDEAVFTGHRVKDASVGKCGGEFTETCNNVNVAPFIARAFASVGGASPNHGHDQYGFLVGNPSSVKLENCEPSAGLSLDESCMPEVEGEACRKHIKVPVGTELVSLSSVMPRPAGVPDGTFVTSVANVASMTGTVGASSASSFCFAVVEPLGETSSAAFAAVHSGADVGVASALCGGDAGGVAITCDGNAVVCTVSGAFGFGSSSVGALVSGAALCDALGNGARVSGALSSGVPSGELPSAALVGCSDSASFSCAIGGMKRVRDEEDAPCARHEQPKKRKVISPLCDGMPLVKARLEIGAIAATMAVNDALVRAGFFATGDFNTGAFCAGAFGAFSAFGAPALSAGSTFGASDSFGVSGTFGTFGAMVKDAMDVCELNPPPPSPTPMDLDSGLAVLPGDMDIDQENVVVTSHSWQPSATTNVSSDGKPLLVTAGAANTAATTATAATLSYNAAPTATTAGVTTPTTTFTGGMEHCMPTTTTTTTNTTRRPPIARPNARSLTLRSYAILNAAHQQQQQQTTATVQVASSTIATHATTTTAATATATTTAEITSSSHDRATITHATADPSNSSSNDEKSNNTSSSSRLELEEFDLDAAEYLNPDNWKDAPSDQYDEFEGFNFSEYLNSTD